MKMKSLLLGAAAGIATVGVAQAADLPMTKAEAVEYVKVCSEFGPGFFYIPGTDTCLKIGGNLRADYTFTNANSRNRLAEGGTRAVDQTSFQGRAQIGFDARTSTDFGLLRSFVQLNAVTGNSNNQTWAYGSVSGSKVAVDKAFIQFGGLTAGFAESQFAYFDNYFGDSFFAPYYGSGGTGTKQQLAYTAQFGGGFSATLSIEDPKGERTNLANGLDYAGTQSPDIVGNVHLEQGWGSLQVMAAAHQARSLQNVVVDGDDNVISNLRGSNKWGFAVGAGGSIKLPVLSGAYIALEGVYADGATAYSGVGNNATSPAGSPFVADAYFDGIDSVKTVKSWAITGEAGVNFTPQLSGLLFGSYGDYNAPANFADFKAYVAGVQLKYEIVKNFSVGGEVYYAGTDSDAYNVYDANGNLLDKRKTGAWVGGIRIRRDF